LFVSNSQVIGCEDRLRNDLYCVGWSIKVYSVSQSLIGRLVNHVVDCVKSWRSKVELAGAALSTWSCHVLSLVVVLSRVTRWAAYFIRRCQVLWISLSHPCAYSHQWKARAGRKSFNCLCLTHVCYLLVQVNSVQIWRLCFHLLQRNQ